ncbi:uncharacterized protein ACNS7B_002100 [Menidia menidia]
MAAQLTDDGSPPLNPKTETTRLLQLQPPIFEKIPARFKHIQQTSPNVRMMLKVNETDSCCTTDDQHASELVVELGDGVSLRCGDGTLCRPDRSGTFWIFSNGSASVTLSERGPIQAGSDRLGLTEDCSLVIKGVTAQDVGRYTCGQIRPGPRGPGRSVRLSVVSMTDYQTEDEVVLFCSVLESGVCRHTVEWLEEDPRNRSSMIAPLFCFATLTLSPAQLRQKSKPFKCKVMDGLTAKEQLFSFRPKLAIHATKPRKSTKKPPPKLPKPTTAAKSAKAPTRRNKSAISTRINSPTNNNNPTRKTATTWRPASVLTARAGEEVALPCGPVADAREKCGSTTWIFSERNASVTLFELGRVPAEPEGRSGGMRVREDCSLVLNVRGQDAGRYVCGQFLSGQHPLDATAVDLSVVDIAEQRGTDKTTVNCSLREGRGCGQTVEWLFEGSSSSDVRVSARRCSAALTFPTPPAGQRSELYRSLRCRVRDLATRTEKLFPVSHPAWAEKTETGFPGLLRYTVVSVALAAQIATVVVVCAWTKSKGGKTQPDENGVSSSTGRSNRGPKS